MQLSSLFLCAALAGTAGFAQDPTLLDTIITPERAQSPINQTLTGAWAALVKRAAPPGAPVPDPSPVFLTFHSDGTMTGSGVGTDSAFQGVWMRVGDRKFLVTYLAFNYDDTRKVVSIAKIRMTTQIDAAGVALQGRQEVLVVDPAGKALFTALGGSHAMVRLSPEKPADFEAFLLQD